MNSPTVLVPAFLIFAVVTWVTVVTWVALQISASGSAKRGPMTLLAPLFSIFVIGAEQLTDIIQPNLVPMVRSSIVLGIMIGMLIYALINLREF